MTGVSDAVTTFQELEKDGLGSPMATQPDGINLTDAQVNFRSAVGALMEAVKDGKRSYEAWIVHHPQSGSRACKSAFKGLLSVLMNAAGSMEDLVQEVTGVDAGR